jgi:hypothetical protein
VRGSGAAFANAALSSAVAATNVGSNPEEERRTQRARAVNHDRRGCAGIFCGRRGVPLRR